MRNPFTFKRAEPEKPKLTTPQMVWDSPVDFNRATRRSVGLYGRFWRWNPQPNTGAGGRYVRRHYTESVFTNPKTRRQRRHRARILRALTQGAQ